MLAQTFLPRSGFHNSMAAALQMDLDLEAEGVESEGVIDLDSSSMSESDDGLVLTQDFLELFSPPRVNIHCRELGMVADYSIDLLTGYDMTCFEVRAQVTELLRSGGIRFAMMSPPCTMYSQMQVCFKNFEKMNPLHLERKWQEAHLYVDFCMIHALEQWKRGLWFCFEHPARASSWQRSNVQQIAALPGVQKTEFHQCRLGLKTPVTGEPIKKATALMSNAPAIAEAFSQMRCNCTVPHRHIEGSEGGIQLSKWCQCYPRNLCALLAQCVQQTLQA